MEAFRQNLDRIFRLGDVIDLHPSQVDQALDCEHHVARDGFTVQSPRIIMAQTKAVAPVISGPSQADGIARFALRTKYEDLTAERRERLKVSILDAVACAINALGAPPIEACRGARPLSGHEPPLIDDR